MSSASAAVISTSAEAAAGDPTEAWNRPQSGDRRHRDRFIQGKTWLQLYMGPLQLCIWAPTAAHAATAEPICRTARAVVASVSCTSTGTAC